MKGTRPQAPARIGIDLGGTKTEIVMLGARGRERLRRRVPTPRDDYDATLDTIVALVNDAERAIGQTATVGIGIPGAISPASGRVKNANSTWLNGRALHDDLERRLARPVRIENDANCLAMSEAADGAAAGAGVVFAAILGTGVGAGIVVHGRPLRGANAIAGEWGHNPLPPVTQLDASRLSSGEAAWRAAMADAESRAPRCYCGRLGCVETWLSGPALRDDHARVAGVALDAPAIVEGARHGDPACADTLARYVDRLARALASVIDVLDPDAIVLGGGLSNVDALYRDVPARWGRYVFSDAVATRLLRNRHGDSSGVRGAARLWDAPGG